MNNTTVNVISADNTYEETLMTNKEIVERLLNGASLRTFMVPDSSIPSNYPEHIETYDLPHVIINGEFFWGKSETAHLFHNLGSPDAGQVAFCYTNIGNIFCSYNPTINEATIMSKKRYRIHKWILKENYRLIWDSYKAASEEDIKKEIELGSKFKIAMLDSKDIWNIHPVDLPMYYPGERGLDLKTVFDYYPSFFRDISFIRNLLKDHDDFFNIKPKKNISGRVNVNSIPSFYSVKSDGNYYGFYDVPQNATQKYKRLKVFVDRIND